MKSFANLALAALLAGGAAAFAATPAPAAVTFSVGVYGNGDYDYYRPCSFYRYHRLPAPARCYRYLRGYYGPGLFMDGDFIFRDRDHYRYWRGRDDYRHWRHHDFRHDHWDHDRDHHHR